MHHYNVRVYYEDTDAGGIVYYANYLKFAERARTEMLRDAGIDQSLLMEKDGTAFVVRRAEMELIKPAKLDDLLTIVTCVSEYSATGMRMEQKIMRDELLLNVVTTQIVAVDMAKMKPVRLPGSVKEALLMMSNNSAIPTA